MTALTSALLAALALSKGETVGSLWILLAIVAFYGTLAVLLGWLLVKIHRQTPPPLPVDRVVGPPILQ